LAARSSMQSNEVTVVALQEGLAISTGQQILVDIEGHRY
jgi:hypothetical protein